MKRVTGCAEAVEDAAAVYERRREMRLKLTSVGKQKKLWFGVVAVVALGILGSLGRRAGPERRARGAGELTHGAEKQVLVIDLDESGSLKAKKSTSLSAKIQRQATLLYLVDEGTWVKEGTVLAELDKTELQKELERSLISLEAAKDDVAQKEKDLEIQKIQSEGDLVRAELKVEMTRMEMDRYEKGEGPQKIMEAKAGVEKAERDMKGMPDLLGKGFVTQNEFLDAQVALQKAQTNYNLLMTYTHPKDLKKNKTDHEDALRELQTTKTRLEAVMAQKKSALDRARRQLKLQQEAVEKVQKDIEAMTIKAPNDGIVIYGTGDPRDLWRAREIRVGGSIYGQQPI